MPENKLFDTQIVRYSDFEENDEYPSKFPVFNPLTGEQITDSYQWHVYQAMSAIGIELAAHMVEAVKNKQALVVMFTHYREQEGHDCRAVVMAKIAKRTRPPNMQMGDLGENAHLWAEQNLDELIEIGNSWGWVFPDSRIPPMGTEAFERAIRSGYETKGDNDDGPRIQEGPEGDG